MATPRKRWFKMADAVLREEWDDATFATVARLMAWLNQRYARDAIEPAEAGNARLWAEDAMAITRVRSSTSRAFSALVSRLKSADLETLVIHLVQRNGQTCCEILWPKFPEFQEYGARSPGESPGRSKTGEVPHPSPISDLRSPRREEEETIEPGAVPRADLLRGKAEPPAAEAAASPLLNLLGKMEGEREEKALWLEAELPIMEAEADGDMKKLRSLVPRYYRRYLTHPEREFREKAKRRREHAAAERWRATVAAEREADRLAVEAQMVPRDPDAPLEEIFHVSTVRAR